MEPLKCHLCEKTFTNNSGGQLTQHLEKIHNSSLREWVIVTKLNNIKPVCKCGLCDLQPVFYRGNFKQYALGHQSFKKREELYIAKFGAPTCLNCGKKVRFRRGKPTKYCSPECSGKCHGFSLPETQTKIRQIILEKYGVDNVSLVPEIRDKIRSKSEERITKFKQNYICTPEIRAKISANSRKLWQDPDFRQRVTKGVKEATNRPEERARRSEQARRQMNDPELFQKFFGRSPGYTSKLHLQIRKDLQLELRGFKSEQIIGPFIVDELNSEYKIAIEINGNYVHANPALYCASDIIRVPGDSYTAQERWDRDAKKTSYLESIGYKVIVIWEKGDLKIWEAVLTELVG